MEEVNRGNGFPDKFIDRHWKEPEQREKIQIAEKKTLFIRLPFKGDTAAERITRTLSTTVKATFNAAKLRCVFSTSPVIRCENKDKLPLLTSSMLIYKFKCTCGATYVGRTTRQLSKRISEHNPRWLRHGGNGIASSAIVAHLVDTGHPVDPESTFSIIHRVPQNTHKAVRLRTLATAEAIHIRLLKPDLCSQRKFVQALLLPWPKIDQLMRDQEDDVTQQDRMT